MKIPKITLPEKIKPYKGVILFATILLVSNFFWKYNVLGDEVNGLNAVITFWGINITPPFVWMAKNVAHVTETLLQNLNFKVHLEPNNVLRHANGNAVQIIWACTGLKQAYIFICIIAFNRGTFKKKLWFIPSGLLAIYAFNIFRIAFIVGCIGSHPGWFEFLHLYLFKYMFYLLIFFMWVLWEEKLAS